MMVEQADLPVIDVSGGTLPPSDPFATPGPSLAEVFASPPAQSQVQEVTDTGSMSLAEAFASPPPEMVTTILPPEASANVTGEIVNQLSQPIVAIAGSLYNTITPDFMKDKIAEFVGEKYFGLVDGLSFEEIGKINTTGLNKTKATEDIVVMSGSDKYKLQSNADGETQSFKSVTQSIEFGKAGSFLDQIMGGLFQGKAVTQTFAEGTDVALQSDMTRQSQTIDGVTSVDSEFTRGYECLGAIAVIC